MPTTIKQNNDTMRYDLEQIYKPFRCILDTYAAVRDNI